jgi:hypothetical protein
VRLRCSVLVRWGAPAVQRVGAMGCACGAACWCARGERLKTINTNLTCRLVDALSESKKMWLCAPSDSAIAEMLEKFERGTRSDLLKTIM